MELNRRMRNRKFSEDHRFGNLTRAERGLTRVFALADRAERGMISFGQPKSSLSLPPPKIVVEGRFSRPTYYRGFGGGGFGTPVVSYAPRPIFIAGIALVIIWFVEKSLSKGKQSAKILTNTSGAFLLENWTRPECWLCLDADTKGQVEFQVDSPESPGGTDVSEFRAVLKLISKLLMVGLLSQDFLGARCRLSMRWKNKGDLSVLKNVEDVYRWQWRFRFDYGFATKVWDCARVRTFLQVLLWLALVCMQQDGRRICQIFLMGVAKFEEEVVLEDWRSGVRTL